MNDVVTLRVQSFGERRVFAYCNHESKDLCTVRHNYVTGREPPHYPVPAIPLEVRYYRDWIDIVRKHYKKRLRTFYRR